MVRKVNATVSQAAPIIRTQQNDYNTVRPGARNWDVGLSHFLVRNSLPNMGKSQYAKKHSEDRGRDETRIIVPEGIASARGNISILVWCNGLNTGLNRNLYRIRCWTSNNYVHSGDEVNSRRGRGRYLSWI
jgi:hypothetical protein